MNNFKFYFNLNNEQINDFYNLLTKEGERDIFFEDFKDLIYTIEKNNIKKRSFSEILLNDQCIEFLKNHLFIFKNIKNKEVFKNKFFELMKDTSFSLEDINDEVLEDLFYKINDYFKDDEERDEKDFIEKFISFQSIEKVSQQNEEKKKKENFRKITKYLHHQFFYFLKKLTKLKNNFHRSAFESCFKDFLMFSEILEKKLKDLDNNNLYLNNKVKILETKLETKIKELLIKDRSLKNFLKDNEDLKYQIDRLNNEKSILKESISKIGTKYEKTKQKNYDLKINLSKYENEINLKHNDIKNLKKEMLKISSYFGEFKENLKKDYKKKIVFFKNKIQKKESVANKENVSLLKNLNKKFSLVETKNYKIQEQEKIYQKKIDCLEKRIYELEHIINNQKQLINRNLNTNNTIEKLSIQSFSGTPSIEHLKIPNEINVRKSLFSNNSYEKNILEEKTFEIKSKNVIKNIPSIKEIFFNKNFNMKKKYDKFCDYAYLCTNSKKELVIFQYEKNIITILKKKKIFLELETKSLITIEKSLNNPFLLNLKFLNKKNKEKEILIESPNYKHLLEILTNSENFNKFCIKKIKILQLETNFDFNNTSLNIFKFSNYCGFGKLYVNSIFYDWIVIYFVLVGNNFFVFKLPSIIFYNKFSHISDNLRFYRLEHFNIMKFKKHNEEKNMFALKLINLKKDFIIRTLSEFQYSKCIDSFYNIFD